MAQGVETRVPFLDKDFLDVVWDKPENSLKRMTTKENILSKSIWKCWKPYLPMKFYGDKKSSLVMV
jgi:asparagine synthetase B (glutamine-hydrolysing)